MDKRKKKGKRMRKKGGKIPRIRVSRQSRTTVWKPQFTNPWRKGPLGIAGYGIYIYIYSFPPWKAFLLLCAGAVQEICWTARMPEEGCNKKANIDSTFSTISTALHFRRAEYVRRGWIRRFWGAPIFSPEVPKPLF